MGIFEKIFGNKGGQEPKKWKERDTFKMLTAYTPTLRHWNAQLYESDLIRAAVNTIATHCSKLDVVVQGSANPKLQTIIKDRPNDFNTWSQFLYRTATILQMQNTVIITPAIDEYGDTVGFFPILPNRIELLEYDGVPYIRYHFKNGRVGAMELSRVGILTKYQYESDLFGESNEALRNTMDLITIQNQGIQEAIKNGSAFRFMAKVTNFSDPEDLANVQKEFNGHNLNAEAGGGLLVFPNTMNDIKQIDSKPYTVSAEQMELIHKNIYHYFGVNEKALTNAMTGDEWASFYEGVIEPFAIQFSSVMSKVCFSANERSRGARVFATSNRLQYMSNADKLAVSAQMADRGIMNRDEIREIWNLPPLPDGQGQAYIIRGEYYNADEKITEDETGGIENGN